MAEETGPEVRVSRRAYLNRVAERLDMPVEIVREVYNALTDEMMEIVSGGGSLLLQGLGRYYPQQHKGHRVRFVDDGTKIQDYRVLKFSATRDVNRQLDDDNWSPTSNEVETYVPELTTVRSDAEVQALLHPPERGADGS